MKLNNCLGRSSLIIISKRVHSMCLNYKVHTVWNKISLEMWIARTYDGGGEVGPARGGAYSATVG